MSNAYYQSGKLDREFLRLSAVYRCLVRYGASPDWAVAKLGEVMRDNRLARSVVECWMQSLPYLVAVGDSQARVGVVWVDHHTRAALT